uniref:Uncharacterized protein n=1 Tax=Gasterosteus aculeatus TaxID=69293 RepID=G3NUK1_GASAC
MSTAASTWPRTAPSSAPAARNVAPAAPTRTTTSNSRPPSSARGWPSTLKNWTKWPATLEEMAPLSSRRTAAGGGGRNALRTFRTSATSSFSDADGRRTPSALRSGASSGSTGEGNAGPGGGASRSNPLKVE